ncbi:RDD family protein [Quatrionicoccus australiensis]|uniref:RDD family protein n=1 Tax=Quatrionicoccus australiensis TaxID=138118 RepID=UPI001CF7F78D|nr:RDD family protein [Quatrionicoccus australiensis]UCV16285.1 RDD family protein [Quatrionicoccus australiensis]
MPSQIASLGRRLTCLLYESLVVFSILLIGFLIPQSVFFAFGLQLGGKVLMLHIWLLLMFYFVWSWLNGRQTLPMKTWKLALSTADGSSLRPTQALLRYLAAWPSIGCFGIGIIWAVFDKDKQFLHDRIAGTRIISTNG